MTNAEEQSLFDAPADGIRALLDICTEVAGDAESPGTASGPSHRFGKFEVVCSLGCGGMGEVFEAIEPVTDTRVAVKVLREEWCRDKRIVKSFLREARHMYQLSHPSILKVLEVSDAEDGPYLVMPLMQHGSLGRRIANSGALPRDLSLAIAIQIAEGLTYAHGKGLIHRDLKPANVLLDDGDRALLSDFGLVRSYVGDSMVDVSRSVPEGTPAYMSPGVAAGQAEDTRCDIYAFGAMLYEMLSGRAPYAGRDAAEVIHNVLRSEPAALTAVAPGADKRLVAIAQGCMARELRNRYASMEDVLADLQRVRDGQPVQGPHGRGVARPSRRWWVWGAVGILLLAGILGVTWRLGRRPAAIPPPGLPAPVGVPGDLRVLMDQAARAQAEGQPRMATDLYREALRRDPSNAEAASALIEGLIEVGHIEPARRELELWLERDPDSVEANALRARLEAAQPRDGMLPPRRRPPPREAPTGRPAQAPPPGTGR